ncbi:MAG: 50S ribosomal protein L3 [Candidatus Woesebacteria bacterium]
MITQILATKRHMTQVWTTNGIRIPVSVLRADDCMVIKPGNRTGKLLVGAAAKKLKNVKKPQRSQLEKAGFSIGFRKVAEVMVDGNEAVDMAAGTKILASDVLTVGDMVKVTGTSKGKGFTGVVKRWGFKGGPRTHGQADRERAPGSIGSGTTPGRVYKNKKMAGRSGNETVTVLGLQVVAINGDDVWVKGLVPGAMNGVVTITKTGTGKFAGLIETKKQLSNAVEAAQEVTETVQPEPVIEVVEEKPTEEVVTEA